MIKKTIKIGLGLGLLVGVGLLLGRSHVMTAAGIAKQAIRDTVPVEFELKRARQMIRDLQPEIERNMHAIAEVEVSVARLERDVAKLDQRVAGNRDDILKLKNDLDSGSESFVYAGRNYTAKQVKTDLVRRFDQFRTEEQTLASKQQQLSAKQEILAAAREKLESMLAAKRQLEVDVEQLDARVKLVQAAQTTSDFKFDDSRLSRTQELIDEINTRIEVAEKLVNADAHYHDRIPLEQAAAERDISEEIADHFGERRAEIESFVNSAASL